MGLSLPLELIHYLIKASRDDLTTLLQFSLVSRQCLAESRRYAFERVQLGRDSTWHPTVSQGPMNSASERLFMESSRIKEFHALLLASTTLGTYIRDLDVGVGSFLSPRKRPRAAQDAFTHDLPAILDLLPSLTSFGITYGSHSFCSWTDLPRELQESIARCCSSPRIKRLGFTDFTEFPYTLVNSPPNLEELHLSYIFEAKTKSEPTSQPLVRQSRQMKTVSAMAYGSSIVGKLIAEDPGAFSCVVTINWHIQSQVDVDVFGRLTQLCARTLQEVSLEFGVRIGLGHATNLDALELMPQIKRLYLSSRIHLPDTEFEGEYPRFGLSYDLALYQSILQTQHELDVLEVKIELSTYTNFTSTCNLPSRILHNRRVWRTFDEYLASPSARDLPAPIGFHVVVSWGSAEDHQPWDPKEWVFRGQLQKEMRGRLKRSLEAGRISTDYTWYT
ncbi:hypothetical protein DFP72DRAFT_528475 [Ephemerocybe angulata]|uniref:Uncharacterized protein n=1 Tax=Ephemerocybe angulata TaxID=980116 RepID=A0A8H6ICY8_9AGAR|nr:hypothetical protein DFP72DRAFT_528475 [Tulosesus angulatus]